MDNHKQKNHTLNQTNSQQESQNSTNDNSFRCGMIAIVGKPNTGKSTLLNALVGQKVSITSRKAQTTRHRIMGIANKEQAQYVFVDTPGFQTTHNSALNRKLNKTVSSTISGVDIVMMVIQANQFQEADIKIIKLLPKNCPVILICNKVDTISFDNKKTLLPFLKQMSKEFKFTQLIPMSAKNPPDIERLFKILLPYLPEQEAIYGADDLTDKSMRFMASELIREKVFRFTGDELPYNSTIIIDKFEEGKKLHKIFATILVDKTSHKAMVIGLKGEKLKQIGTEARQDMERFFDKKVYLELWVKVKSGWADNEAALRSYGYE